MREENFYVVTVFGMTWKKWQLPHKEGRENRSSITSFLNGRVRLLVLLDVFDVRTAVYVFGARVYRILLASLRYFLVDDTRILVILLILIAGCYVRFAPGANVTRSLLIAATSRCNKQRHDRSRQMCVCEFSTCLYLFLFLLFLLFFYFLCVFVRELVTWSCLSPLPSAFYYISETTL